MARQSRGEGFVVLIPGNEKGSEGLYVKEGCDHSGCRGRGEDVGRPRSRWASTSSSGRQVEKKGKEKGGRECVQPPCYVPSGSLSQVCVTCSFLKHGVPGKNPPGQARGGMCLWEGVGHLGLPQEGVRGWGWHAGARVEGGQNGQQ